MNRTQFLSALRRGLSGLPQAQIDDIIADYESHFAEAAAAGRSEDDVANALGDPSRLARELRAEAGIKRWETERSAESYIGAIFALLGLATFDLIFLLPMLLLVAGLLMGLCGALIGMFAVGAVALVASPFLPHVVGQETVMGLLFALGCLTGSIGGGALIILILNGLIKLLASYGRVHYRLLTSAK